MTQATLLPLLANFRYHLRSFLLFSERALSEAGISSQQYQVLLQIAGAPPGTAATIAFCAQRLGIRHHSAVELVNRCAASGLIVRRPSSTDRRSVIVELTPKAHDLLANLSQQHACELGQAAPQLIQTLESILEQARPVFRAAQ